MRLDVRVTKKILFQVGVNAAPKFSSRIGPTRRNKAELNTK